MATDGAPLLEVELAHATPLAWRELLAFLGARATPGVEAVWGEAYRRTFSQGTAAGALEVRPRSGALVLTVFGAAAGADLERRVRALLDLDADTAAIATALRRDALLRPLVARAPGLRVPGAFEGFEVAVRAILGQQVTVAGATTLAGRLAAAYGAPVKTPLVGMTRLFPTPERLAAARIERIGLPRTRADALRGLARAVLGGLALVPSAGEDAVRALLAIRGVGAWTAAYVAMRALRAPDAFPDGDLALRRVLEARLGRPLAAREIAARAERWRPWRAYAAMHLWASAAGAE